MRARESRKKEFPSSQQQRVLLPSTAELEQLQPMNFLESLLNPDAGRTRGRRRRQDERPGVATAAAAAVDDYYREILETLSATQRRQRTDRGGGHQEAAHSDATTGTNPFFAPFTTTAMPPPPPSASAPHPPCSRKVLERLPQVVVGPEDWVYEGRRHCSVCWEEHQSGHIAIRLPCAHLFHRDCIIPWLEHSSCACPVCRYLLPTDDPSYEVIRINTMQDRRPQFCPHELCHLAVPQLRELGPSPPGCRDKSDWVRHLISSDRIRVWPNPPPIPLHWSDVQSMTAKQLKDTLRKAGIDPDHATQAAIETSDLRQLLLSSNRVEVVGRPPPPPPPPLPQSSLLDSSEDSADGNCDPTSDRAVESTAGTYQAPTKLPPSDNYRTTRRGRTVRVETVLVDNDDVDEGEVDIEGASDQGDCGVPGAAPENDPLRGCSVGGLPAGEEEVGETELGDGAIPVAAEVDLEEEVPRCTVDDEGEVTGDDTTTSTAELPEDDRSHSTSELPEDENVDSTQKSLQVPTPHHNDYDALETAIALPNAFPDYAQRRLRSWGVRQLQNLAQNLSVDVNYCRERGELAELLVDVLIRECYNENDVGPTESSRRPPPWWEPGSWSACERCVLASVLDLHHVWPDAAAAAGSTAAVPLAAAEAARDRLWRAAHAPHLAALYRLQGRTAGQLRDLARQWRVDASDCPDKADLLLRLFRHHQRRYPAPVAA